MTSYKGLKSCNISLYRKALFVTWLLYYSSMITLSVVTVVATMNKPSITRLSPHTDSYAAIGFCSRRSGAGGPSVSANQWGIANEFAQLGI